MTKPSYATQQAEIAKEIDRLIAKSAKLRRKHSRPMLVSIIRSMREFGITPDEIAAAYASRQEALTRPLRETSSRRVVAPKYRNVITGETWSGRGRTPRWLIAAEAKGISRSIFLI